MNRNHSEKIYQRCYWCCAALRHWNYAKNRRGGCNANSTKGRERFAPLRQLRFIFPPLAGERLAVSLHSRVVVHKSHVWVCVRRLVVGRLILSKLAEAFPDERNSCCVPAAVSQASSTCFWRPQHKTAVLAWMLGKVVSLTTFFCPFPSVSCEVV